MRGNVLHVIAVPCVIISVESMQSAILFAVAVLMLWFMPRFCISCSLPHCGSSPSCAALPRFSVLLIGSHAGLRLCDQLWGDWTRLAGAGICAGGTVRAGFGSNVRASAGARADVSCARASRASRATTESTRPALRAVTDVLRAIANWASRVTIQSRHPALAAGTRGHAWERAPSPGQGAASGSASTRVGGRTAASSQGKPVGLCP